MVDLETKYRVPTVAVHVHVFERLVSSVARVRGVPKPRQVFVPTPVLNKTASELRAYIEGDDPIHRRPVMEVVLDALTKPLGADQERGASFDRSAPRHVEEDSEEALQRRFRDQHWTDFLPVVLPTEERVAQMLKGTSHAPDELVGERRSAGESWAFDVEKVAVNAVMAGAEAEHLPVILALAASGATARNASMSSMGSMVCVNGPIRNEIAMNAGIGALGPYNYANAAIGRAFCLLSQNLQGGSVPGVSYGGSQGSNFAYSSCTFAENEEASPWEPLHVRRGFARDESTVTAFNVWGNTWSSHLRTYWPEKVAAMVSALDPLLGVTFVLDPIVAKEFVERGVATPEQLASWVREHVRIPSRRYWDHITTTAFHPQVEAGVEPFASKRQAAPDELVALFEPDQIAVVVVGGSTSGNWSTFMGKPRMTVSVDPWR